MRVFNRHFNIKGRTKLFGLFKKNEARYSYFQRRGIGTGKRKNYLFFFLFGNRDKNFIESARKICGMDCEITVDTLEAHYWNYKTDPKEQDKSWGDSIYTDFADFKHEALKICVEIRHPNLAQKLCEHFSELDSQHFSDGDWYKFTKSGITKEKAILAVCEACHTDVSEIAAFGDDYADMGMLNLCGIGVAMDNAVQEVKDIADDITLSNEEDGVAAYLEKWII